MAQSLEEMVDTLQAALAVNPRDAWKRLRLGKLFARLGREEAAFETLRRALRDDPKLAEAHVALATLHDARGEAADRERELTDALAVDPGHVEATYELARLRAGQARHEEALALLARPAWPPPWLPRSLRARAASEGKLGRWDRALELLEQARQVEPENVDLREELGLAYFASERWPQAAADLGPVVATDPTRIAAQRGLVRAQLALGEGAAALAGAERLLARLPEDVDARADRASALVMLGRGAEALPLFKEETVDPRLVGPLCRSLIAVGRGADALQRARALAKAHPGEASVQALLGEVLATVGHDGEAVVPLRQALRLGGSVSEAGVVLAQVYERLGQPRDALELLEAACAERPAVAPLLVSRGRAELAAGLLEKAAATFAEAGRLDETSVPARVGRAQALVALGRPGDAIAAYREVLDLDAGRGEDWLERGRLELAEQRLEDAASSLGNADRLLPESADAAAQLGAALFGLHRLGPAIQAFSRAVALRPNDAASWLALGRAYAEVFRSPEAIGALERATQLDSESGTAFLLLGRERAAIKRDDLAVPALEVATQLLPGDPAPIAELGLALSRLRRWSDAVPVLRSAVQRGAKTTPVLAALAQGCLGLGSPSEAAEWYTKLASAEPEVAEHHVGRAAAWLALDRRAEAEAALVQAVRLDPGHSGAQQQLGRLEWERGERGSALLRLQRAAEGFIDDDDAWCEFGQAALAMGAARDAERAFRRRLELVPGDFDGLSGLARAFEALERWPEAIEHFRRCLALRSEAVEDRRRLGLLLARLQRDEEAIRELVPALAGVDDPALLEVLADSHLRLHEDEAATVVLERALGDGAGPPALHAKAGLAYDRLGREKRARKHLELAIQDEKDPAVIEALGHLYVVEARRRAGTEDDAEAVGDYERAMPLRPLDVELRWELGGALRRLDRRARAVEVLREGARLAARDARFPLALGELSFEEGQHDAALGSFELALSLDPSCFEAQRGRARTLVALGRASDATAELRRAVAARPDATEECAVLGELLIELGKPEEALPVLTELVARCPLSARALGLLGTAQQQLLRHPVAVTSFRRALEVDPSQTDTAQQLATSLVALERWGEALPVLERLEGADPSWRDELCGLTLAGLGRDADAVPYLERTVQRRTDPVLLRALARSALRAGEPGQAAQAAHRLLEELPQDLDALRTLAAAEAARQDRDAEARAWQRLLAIAPGDPEARHGLAAVMRQEAERAAAANPGLAVDRFREIAALRAEDPVAHRELGEALDRMGDAQGALAAVRHGLSAAHPDAPLATLAGTLLLRANELEEARAMFDLALRCNPRHVPALAAMADVLVRLDDASGAVEALADLVDVDENAIDAWRRLAELQNQLGRHGASADAYERVAALGSLGLDEQVTWGLARREAGQLEGACELLSAVVNELPDQIELALALADVQRRLGRRAEELATLEGAANHAPDDLVVAAELARAQAACEKWEAACTTYERARGSNPTEPWLREWLAAAEQANHVPSQIRALTELTALQPDDAEAWYQLGRAEWSSGRAEAALPAFERARSLAPRNRSIARDLATMAIELASSADAPNVSWLVLATEHGEDEPDLLVIAARLWRRAGELTASRDAARTAVEGAPNDVEALVLLAELEEQLGDLEPAARTFEQALRVKVDAIDALRGLARVELALGDARATKTAERLIALTPDDELGRSLAAEAAEAAGAPERAVEHWQWLLTNAPSRDDARPRLARLLGELGRHRDRIELLTGVRDDDALALMLAMSWLAVGEPGRAAGVAPTTGSGDLAGAAWAVKARALVAVGTESDAAAAFEQSFVNGNRSVVEEWHELVVRLGRHLPWRDAADLLARTVEHAPAASLLTLLAERELEGGRAQPGLAAAQRALTLGAGAEAWRLVGTAYERVGDERAAAEAFAKAAGADPTDRTAVLGVARMERAGGRHAEAIAALKRRVVEDPHDTEALALLADSYDATGEIADAVRAWQQLLGAGKLAPEACARLGHRCLELGRAEAAAEAFEEALDAAPDEAELLTALGDARLRMNDPEAATPPLEKAIRLGAATPPTRALLARAHLGCRRYVDAIAALAKTPIEDDATLRVLLEAATQAQDDAECVRALEGLIAVAPSPSWFLALADVFERGGRRRDAINRLRAAERTPDLEQRLVSLCLDEGDAALSRGEPELTRLLLEEVASLWLEPVAALRAARLARTIGHPSLVFRVGERALVEGAPPEVVHDARLLLGAVELASGGKDRALSHYRAAIEARFDSVEALLGAAACAFELGDLTGGAPSLVRALRLEPTRVQGRTLAWEWARRVPTAELVPALALLVEANPDDTMAHRELGHLLAAGGQAGEAVEHLREAMRLGTDPDTLALLARLSMEVGDDETARAAADEALTVAPSHRAARTWRAVASLPIAAATELPTMLADLRPDLMTSAERARVALALARRASELEAAGDPGSAALVYGKIEVIDPQQGRQQALQGARAALAAGDLGLAAQRAESATRARADDVEAHVLLGEIRERAGADAEALAAYGAALGIDRGHPAALRGYGLTAARLGRHEDALRTLQAGIPRQPGPDPEMVATLGGSAEALGRRAEAVDSLRQLAALRPLTIGEERRLGSLLLASSDPAEAVRHLEAAATAKPEPAILDELAKAYERSGNLAGAISELQRLAELAPDHPGLQARLGQLLVSSGDHRGALRSLEMALNAEGERVELLEAAYEASRLAQDRSGVLRYGARLAKVAPRPEVLLSLGNARLAAGDVEGALVVLSQAVEQGTVEARDVLANALGERAAQYASTGDGTAAAVCLRQALELNPEHVEHRYRLGLLELEAGDLLRAREDLARAARAPDASAACLGATLRAAERMKDAKLAILAGERLIAQTPTAPTARSLAGACEAEGKTAEAIRYYECAVACEPRDVIALLAMARLHARAGDHAATLTVIGKAVQIEPGNYIANALRADALTRLGRHQDAIPVLEWMLSQHASVETLRQLAYSHASLGQVKEAVGVLERAAQHAPQDTQLLVQLGAARLSAGDPAGAMVAYERVLTLEPSAENAAAFVGVALQVGADSLRAGQAAGAVRWLLRARAIAPDRLDVQLAVVRVALATQNPTLAIDAGRRVASMNDRALETPLILELGRAAETTGDLGEARRYYLLALGREPRNPAALFAVGCLDLREGAPARAAEALTRCRNENPDHPRVATMLALAWLANGAGAQAADLLSAEIQRSPRDGEAHETLGLALARMRHYREAAGACATAAALGRSNATLYATWGECALNFGDMKLAGNALKRALELDPNDPGAIVRNASVVFAEGRREEAIAEVRRAIGIAPREPRSRLELASMYIKMNRADLARPEYEALRQLDPEMAARLSRFFPG
ncbi:MAG: tetratricopeptide repeat protein [Polyangiaceae bacterium]|nr:tetratricopeptide repeat protein [Polyangiaceae bacterium]